MEELQSNMRNNTMGLNYLLAAKFMKIVPNNSKDKI